MFTTSQIVDQVLAEASCETREYQVAIVRKALSMYLGEYTNIYGDREKSTSIMVESPTGSGKTCMAHLIVKCMQKLEPDLVFAWVAMRRNLLSQAAAENKSLGINVENIHYISMFNEEPEELVEAKRQGKPIMVIVDESHHAAANSMIHLYNLLEPKYILGMTATPFRTDKMRLCFDKVVKDAGIHQLIQQGYLSQFDHYSIDDWTPQSVANHYCSEPERWGQSVVFFHQWEDVLEFRNLVQEREQEVRERLAEHRPDMLLDRSLVEVVRGGGTKQDYDQRDELLEDFRQKRVGVLVNCMVLTEGFDAPQLETAFVRDSIKGPTMQMAGRAFRIHPEWKQDKRERFRFKQIVQSRHSKYPIIKTAMPRYQFTWQGDGWRSLSVNQNIQDIQQRAVMVLAGTQTSMPQFLQESKKRVIRLPRDRRGGR